MLVALHQTPPVDTPDQLFHKELTVKEISESVELSLIAGAAATPNAIACDCRLGWSMTLLANAALASWPSVEVGSLMTFAADCNAADWHLALNVGSAPS